MKQKNKREDFEYVIGYFKNKFVRNLLAGKRIVRTGSGNKKGKGIVRADSGNEKGKEIVRAGTGKDWDF